MKKRQKKVRSQNDTYLINYRPSSMRKKGYVYRFTVIFGLAIIALQMSSEAFIIKRQTDIDEEGQEKKEKFDQEEEEAEKKNQAKIGFVQNWHDKRAQRLEKVKAKYSQNSNALTMEELDQRPSIKEIKTRKTVIKDEAPKEGKRDNYI